MTFVIAYFFLFWI